MALQVTSYHTINGRLRSERSPSPQPNHEYMQDALGSVTQTTNPSGGSVWMKQRYHGYGTRAFTSASSVRQPNYQWVGAWRYRRTARWRCDSYVRARHYSNFDSRWTTVDPLWQLYNALGYCLGNPGTWIDPSGLQGGPVTSPPDVTIPNPPYWLPNNPPDTAPAVPDGPGISDPSCIFSSV